MDYDVSYARIPEHMQEGARDYVERGVAPGDFLAAVLSNDLVGAFSRSDHINAEAMHDWVRWLWNEAPRECWGSPAKVATWIAARKGVQL